jgi:hypothetical protein
VLVAARMPVRRSTIAMRHKQARADATRFLCNGRFSGAIRQMLGEPA